MADVQTLFTTAEAGAFLRYQGSTLMVWRCNGEGPAYIKLGRTIRYARHDLEEWLYGGPSVRRHIEETAACHVEKRRSAKRLRGRAAMVQTQAQLARQPFCRDCLDQGRERLASEVDHIVPLARGGTNDEANLRSLCRPCHALRTY